MAKQIIHKLVDDLDGGDAEETVKFALDGIQYEIDLSDKNAAKLRDVFAPYVAAGSKVARSTANTTSAWRSLTNEPSHANGRAASGSSSAAR